MADSLDSRMIGGHRSHIKMRQYRSGKQRHSGRPPGRRGGYGGYNGGGGYGGSEGRHGGGGDEAPSGVAILAFFTILAVACLGGFFLIMRLIDMSRQEDCIMAGRTNCLPPIELPSNRIAIPRQNPGL
jgi:hypothetical protein